MPTTEHTINDALAALLRETRRAWQPPHVVSSENTGMLKGGAGRPDILIVESDVSPVTIETEVLPATTVESEARSRLGEQMRRTGRAVLSSIAVRLPSRLRDKQAASLRSDLAAATDIEAALYTGKTPSLSLRWPRSGWLPGSVADLSILTQAASVPPEVIDQAARCLVEGVSEAANLLGDAATSYSGAIGKIAEELHQEDGEQTRGMATTILADAFVFHQNLAGGPGDLSNIKSLEQLRGGNGIGKSAILEEWRKILKVNYWPIFDIARRVLELVPATHSKALIERLASTADKLLENRLMRSHDLTGAVFQRLIADRKFLAAYYTTPSAAALLVGLAITPEATPRDTSWAILKDVEDLRVADFACGTGTLLSTAYRRIGQLHELAGGSAEALHPQLMATGIVGCDVLPAAAHLTASMLSGTHPTVKYQQSRILTVAYGKQAKGVALGSLDLLDPQRKFEIIGITAKAIEGMGESEQETWASLPHASFDFVIMNPPFTRATSHEGKKKDIPNPMFAAFSSSTEEQKAMSDAAKRLTAGTSAHGNAGEASIFLVLADRKLKDNGVLALVMPLSLMFGDSWEDSRVLLSKNYRDLIVISIAGTERAELSFSADTGIAECLIVGRKAKSESSRATFIVLNDRPAIPLLGATAATQIRQLIATKTLRCMEDGPVGGTLLRFGDDPIGQAIEAALPEGWNLSRIADLSLAQAAYQIANQKRVWLPGMNHSEAIALPITAVAIIGEIGPIDRDINGKTPTGAVRGPFEIRVAKPKSAPTYPVLWSHDAASERTLLFEADSEGFPHKGSTSKGQAFIDQKVASVWKTASHCHFNRDFRFNSQSTAMQFTPRRSIGGRAWLSIRLSSAEQEKALVLWANTSLGLLLYWWHANKATSGRGTIAKSALHSLPILDITALNPKQLTEAAHLFDALSSRELLPLHQIDQDAVRRELDDKFATKVLGLPEPVLLSLDLLRKKLAQEPSIRGHK